MFGRLHYAQITKKEVEGAVKEMKAGRAALLDGWDCVVSKIVNCVFCDQYGTI